MRVERMVGEHRQPDVRCDCCLIFASSQECILSIPYILYLSFSSTSLYHEAKSVYEYVDRSEWL